MDPSMLWINPKLETQNLTPITEYPDLLTTGMIMNPNTIMTKTPFPIMTQ
jgi:hypothetical protein